MMNRILKLVLALGALTLVAAPPVSAQEQTLSVEIRGGLAVPTGDLADDGLDPGFGYGANLLYSVFPRAVRLYGGYESYGFRWTDDAGSAVGEVTGRAVASGFRSGIRLAPPIGGPVIPFVGAGPTFQRVTTLARSRGAGVTVRSDWAVGWEAEAGIELALPQISFNFSPTVRYRTHPMRFDGRRGEPGDGTATSIVLDIAIRQIGR